MSSASAAINSTNVRNAVAFAWHRVTLAVASKVAADFAVDLAAKLFATPPRYAHTARELEFLATTQGFVVPTEAGRIAAWRVGRADRPAVILVHGWGGRGAQLRSFVAPLVDQGYQVVLFDHVAHGMSEGRQANIVHFMKGIAAVVRTVEAGGAKVEGIVAHSLGAAATGAWLNETRRELRVVLVSPPTSVERYSSYFARRLGIAEPVRRAMQERFERSLGYRWKEFELPNAVANVKAHALVIHDALDREVSSAGGLALARAWNGARFVGTEGLGHRAILRNPGVVRDAADFIANEVAFPTPVLEPAPIL